MATGLKYKLSLVLVSVLAFAHPASACFFGDFDISTAPGTPEANTDFEIIVDYSASQTDCSLTENVITSDDNIRLEITCSCIFITPDPTARQFQATIAGLPAGIYNFEAIHVDSIPAPRTVGSTQILIGHAPAIPISSLALTLLALTLTATAIWVLRR